MHPTPYKDVNETILLLWEHQRQVLGDNAVGFYLGGSLGLGDFDPGSSDIDFLVVTEEPVSDAVLPELHHMHDRIRTTGMHWAQHLEGSYIPRGSLRRYDPNDCHHPSIGVDWAFGVHHHDCTGIIQRWIVRECGITVSGPHPASLIDPISAREMKETISRVLREVWVERLHNNDWLRPRNYQAYAILTMCRARYTLANDGVMVSKPVAAAWARQAFPQWAPLIDRALVWRYDTDPDDMDEMLDFIRDTIG